MEDSEVKEGVVEGILEVGTEMQITEDFGEKGSIGAEEGMEIGNDTMEGVKNLTTTNRKQLHNWLPIPCR